MWESCRGIGGKILGIVSRKKSRPEKETFKKDKEKTEREREISEEENSEITPKKCTEKESSKKPLKGSLRMKSIHMLNQFN